MKYSRLIILFLVFFGNILLGRYVVAAIDHDQAFFINIDKSTADRGYTVNAFDGEVKLFLAPKALTEASGIRLEKIDETMDMPWQLELLSPIYQFDFNNPKALATATAWQIEIKQAKPSNYLRQIYFYDKNFSSWRALPAVNSWSDSAVRAKLSLSFARLAVFANPNALVAGQASWYKHKGGNFAASPDFPVNSRLRVLNTQNNKFIDVTVNDFGPDRRLYPDRAIDLDKLAFKRIAQLNSGVINVKIVPLYIAPKLGKLLGVDQAGAKSAPETIAKAALLYDEQAGQVLWQKNATTTLPLASLSKLIAVWVFLDTGPNLNKVVSYSLKDEEYNYEYASKWESARLKLKNGDSLTVKDLLYSALVGSANNAVETLVRASGLSRADFIGKMNSAVAGWGASSTRFVEPTGLSPENVSSALDYAIITREVFKQPIIEKASTMAEYIFSTINTKKRHKIKNTNYLLTASSLQITGSKTGYLNEALYCLMIRTKNKSGQELITVTFGNPSRDRSFIETEELAKYGFYKLANKI